MIDPLVSLAFSIYSNPGVYALLLGSGLSRSAGIPTGWEVVQDLIRKLALLHGQGGEPDLEQWYKATYKTDPDYSDLLDDLAKTPAERSQILRAYFEPTEEERERGTKMPTSAHRAIAELVKAGYIKIIVTTNFDRLQETALTDVGVQPTVISTADGIKGAVPLPHVRCLILKTNGDYLDSRIKNTQAELSEYDPALNILLDRIFDEFGLVVCGWSGDWDIALRNAIERCPNRRFSMYWAARGEPSPKAIALMNLRTAVLLPIQTADPFFLSLKEKVLALAQFGQNHPVSAKLAATQTKRYLVRPEGRILLHDMVDEETERAYSAMDPKRFHAGHVDPAGELDARFRAYESIVELPLAIIIVGCYWGQQEHEYLWQRMLKRLGDPPGGGGGLIAWIGFRRYPASLLMYAAGIAAIAGQRPANLAAILKVPIRKVYEQKTEIAANYLNVAEIMQNGLSKFIPGNQNRHTPFSDHLFELLREPFRSIVPTDTDYEDAFNLFEYLMSLVVWQTNSRSWAPIGRARWQATQMFTADGATSPDQPRIAAAATALFPKGLDDYNAVKIEYDSWALKNTPGWNF